MKAIFEISINSEVEKLHINEKKNLIKKLISYPQAYASSLFIIDIFTKEKIYCPIKGYVLDDWFWDTEYLYYFDKYDFKINPEFKKVITGNAEINN